MKQYRQGDVLLIEVPFNVDSAQAVIPAEDGRVILARGEATGHHHSLKADVATLFERDQRRYLRVTADTTLDHQEHAPVLVALRTYEVVQQREYEAPNLIRKVVD